MKSALLLVLSATALIGWGCSQRKPEPNVSSVQFDHSGSGVLKISVPEMTCRICVGKITGSVEKLPSVQAVDCDTLGHLVYVKTRPGAAGISDIVRKSIVEAGFRVDSLSQ